MTTEHSALAPQGFVSIQGFRQVPLKQANLLAQSASCLHSTEGGIGAERMWIKRLIYNRSTYKVYIIILYTFIFQISQKL